MTYEQAMERAIALSLQGAGYVSPNPRVGCVILKDGEIIGEGYHHKFGDVHAEVDAIRSATQSVEGATLVVTLEPCSHTGKQPPCINAIKEAGISKVVIGILDPNPAVNGNGVQALKDAGIEVETNVLANECSWANRFFLKHITTGKPYIVAKVAQSLDGCIATSRGESQWLTGDESRRRVHALRSEIDAVLVGKNTALADDPQLTVRDVHGRNPKRIVVDTQLSLPLGVQLFSDAERVNTYVLCSHKAAASRKAENLKVAGVHIIACDETSDNMVHIPAGIDILASQQGISSILVEGGGRILSTFMRTDLIDELHIFTAPLVIGDGKHSFNMLFSPTLKEAHQLQFKAVSVSGNDIHTIAVRA